MALARSRTLLLVILAALQVVVAVVASVFSESGFGTVAAHCTATAIAVISVRIGVMKRAHLFLSSSLALAVVSALLYVLAWHSGDFHFRSNKVHLLSLVSLHGGALISAAAASIAWQVRASLDLAKRH
ncbi:MAG: hypothetical protein MHM6MM_005373 [Cercozoa sp. M6MM]